MSAPVTPGQAAQAAIDAAPVDLTELGAIAGAIIDDRNELRMRLAKAEEQAAQDERTISDYRNALTAMQGERDEARAERDRLAAALRYLAPPDGHWLTCTDDGRLDLRQEVLAMRAHARAALEGGQ